MLGTHFVEFWQCDGAPSCSDEVEGYHISLFSSEEDEDEEEEDKNDFDCKNEEDQERRMDERTAKPVLLELIIGMMQGDSYSYRIERSDKGPADAPKEKFIAGLEIAPGGHMTVVLKEEYIPGKNAFLSKNQEDHKKRMDEISASLFGVFHPINPEDTFKHKYTVRVEQTGKGPAAAPKERFIARLEVAPGRTTIILKEEDFPVDAEGEAIINEKGVKLGILEWTFHECVEFLRKNREEDLDLLQRDLPFRGLLLSDKRYRQRVQMLFEILEHKQRYRARKRRLRV